MHYKSIEIKSITIPTLLITYNREIKSNCKISSQNCPTVSYSRIFTKCLIKVHNQVLRARIANYLRVKNIPKNLAHSVNRWKRNLLLLAWDITVVSEPWILPACVYMLFYESRIQGTSQVKENSHCKGKRGFLLLILLFINDCMILIVFVG